MWKGIAVAEAVLVMMAWSLYYIGWCDTVANASSLKRGHPIVKRLWQTTIVVGTLLAVGTTAVAFVIAVWAAT